MVWCTGPHTLGSEAKPKIPVEPVHAGCCSSLTLRPEQASLPIILNRCPPPRLPAVHVNMKLGLWLSPSRQSVIGYNDSTGIRCSVRTYGPHYAPSLVLSNVPYFRPVCSVASHSPNFTYTYRIRKLDNC